MNRTATTAEQALLEIHDGHTFVLPRCGGVVVAAMGSSHYGLDRAKVAQHNAEMAELEPHADILIANTRIEEDPTRTKYMREVWLRNVRERYAYRLRDRLNGDEERSDVWQIRTEGTWTVVFSGDPMRSPEGVFSTVGGRQKTEHLVRLLMEVSSLHEGPANPAEQMSMKICATCMTWCNLQNGNTCLGCFSSLT